MSDRRTRILYLAPWVDYGGTDKGTIDWFRWLDRDRFEATLVTTQPSANRRLAEVAPYAEETWALPDLMPGEWMPWFIFDLIHSREIDVVHIMNSRLGYDLLPDLACLPRKPKVVVQLHVEEADRMGYVRYVTTRYGNLVDGFSVTSEHLADAVRGYGVPSNAVHVIYTGVDAEEEFSPHRHPPVADFAEDRLQILYPGRVVEQKDPLLMVNVAAGLRDRGVRFRIHVVGEGELEQQVQARVDALGLGEEFAFHPPTTRLQGWYSACDVLLMTSVFEGVPYVVFEAMAMGLPVVAPALPGNVELLGEHGDLVEPRDRVADYVAALAGLADDDAHRESRGRAGRARVLERFSLQRMAAEHCDLYDQLLDDTAVAEEVEAADAAEPPQPIRFRDRPLFGTPLVSAIVPHYNQGRFLVECVDSIHSQTHGAVETIVVDDASTDADAAEALDELERRDDVTVLRLDENNGPSRARNVGIERARGRYVLPVDADNVLLPDAVERLVTQLSEADEEIGFVYPNLQFFGNREDYFAAPAYDLHQLTRQNYIDTCSLFDRAIFDAGERFLEDIRLGHEDWEFVLRLAARGVRGEPAAGGPVLKYRKWGFNRSDAVEYAPNGFHEQLAEISPFHGFEQEVKAESAPALSLILLEPVDTESAVIARVGRELEAQSCIDLELIARYDGVWPAARGIPHVKRIPPALAASAAEALAHARAVARGSVLVVTRDMAGALLRDRGFVERVLRRFALDPELDAIVLLDAGDDGRFAFRALEPQDAPDASPHTVVWRSASESKLPGGLQVDAQDIVPSIARLLVACQANVEWRHSALIGSPTPSRASSDWVPMPRRTAAAALADPRRGPVDDAPALPSVPPGTVPRWYSVPTWTTPQTVLLCRHRELGGERRIVTNDRSSPPGFEAEWYLGLAKLFSFEGTTRLLGIGGDYTAVPRGEWHSTPAEAVELGYLELAAFPLLDSLALAIHRGTGEQVLVSLPADPLLADVDLIRLLGYVEPFPIRPRKAPREERLFGLAGLVKSVDYGARRHRYAIGGLPSGELVGELGALASSPLPGTTPVWIAGDRLIGEQHRPAAGRPDVKAALRWSGAPANWHGFSEPGPKLRAILRRSMEAARQLARPESLPSVNGSQPAGWVFDADGPGLRPVFVSYHPVTGDQLLTRTPIEATDLGYGEPELFGYVQLRAPVTGTLEQRPGPLPWASRFGMTARRG